MATPKKAFDYLSKEMRKQENKIKAIRFTHLSLAKKGRVEVIVSRRKKQRWEKTRAIHGKAIANFLRALGRDPFVYPEPLAKDVNKVVANAVRKNIKEAAKKRRMTKNDDVKKAMISGGKRLVHYTKFSMERGKLGPQGEKLINLKKRLVAMGHATIKHGNPPPYGIRSGRFIKGIRWRFRKGIRPKRG